MSKEELLKLLQKHNKDIFTDELVESIYDTVIKPAVDTQVNERVEEIQNQKEDEVKKIEESIKEKSDEFEKQQKDEIDNIKKNLNEYLKESLEELFEENKVDYQNVSVVSESIEIAKMFKNLGEKFKFNVDNVEEDTKLKVELKESKENYNKIYKENKELSEKILKKEKNEIVQECFEDLTETQQAKLTSLSESVIYNDKEDYKKRIIDIKNVIINKVEEVNESSNENNTEKKDDVEVEIVSESKEVKTEKLTEHEKTMLKYINYK